MAHELDAISEAIGALRASARSLEATLARHCADDDARHRENIAALGANNAAIGALTATLAPLVQTVASMKPIVDSYQTTRLKFTGAIGVVAVLLGMVGWLVEKVIGEAVRWMFQGH